MEYYGNQLAETHAAILKLENDLQELDKIILADIPMLPGRINRS